MVATFVMNLLGLDQKVRKIGDVIYGWPLLKAVLWSNKASSELGSVTHITAANYSGTATTAPLSYFLVAFYAHCAVWWLLLS